MKNNFKIIPIKWILFIYGFFLIYLPDFSHYIKINGLIVYFILTLLFLVRNPIKLKKYLKMKPIFIFILFNILFTMYYAIRTMIAGTSVFDFHNLRIIQNLMPILLGLGCILLYLELEKLQYSTEQKYKFIINIGLAQGIICILMVVFPQLREVAIQMFYKGSTEHNVYITNGRLYGLCDGNYTYSFQILSSLLALFAFNYAYKNREKKYYLISLIIFSSSFLNGRTGIIIYLIGILYLVVREQILKGKVFTLLKTILFLSVSFIFILFLVSKFLPGTMALMNHAILDVSSFMNGNISGTETGYLYNMLNFPKRTIDYIFGAGYRIYGHAGINYGYGLSSDIGFINDLFMAGIFSFLLLYNSIFYMILIIKSFKNKYSFEKCTCSIIIIYFLIANIKGEFFRSQIMISSLLIIIIFMLLEVVKNEKNLNNSSNV